MVKRSKCALCGATRSAYKGFKTPAVGIDAAVKILQDLGTSRWQLRIVFFTPAPVHPKGAPMTKIDVRTQCFRGFLIQKDWNNNVSYVARTLASLPRDKVAEHVRQMI
jgi:hypothetical protein